MPYINTPGGGIGSSVYYSDPGTVTIDNRPLAQQGGWTAGGADTGFATIPVSQRLAQIGRMGGGAGGGGADYDPVFTGHATDRTQIDPRMNTLMPSLLHDFGSGDAPIAERSAGLMQRLRQLGFDAVQSSAGHTRVLGIDPLSLQDRAAKQMEVALRLNELKDKQRVSQMNEVEWLGKQMGARPEDIHQSFNTDPSHPNQFFIPAHQGMSEVGEPAREIQGEWRGADPMHVSRVRQLFESMGIGNSPTRAQVDAAIRDGEHERKGRMGDLRALEGGAGDPTRRREVYDLSMRAGANYAPPTPSPFISLAPDNQEALRRAYAAQAARFNGMNFDTAY